MTGRLFLVQKSLESFQQDRLRFGRHVQMETPDGGRSSEPLEGLVQGLVHGYIGGRDHGFKCRVIHVIPGDGMSWSAHAVDAAIEDAAPQVPRLRLKGELGRGVYPELHEIVPMRRIGALAQKHGLVTSVKLVGKRRYAVIFMGALVVGAAGSALTAVIGKHEPTAASLTWPGLAISVVVAGLALLSQLLVPGLRGSSSVPPLARAAEDIAAIAKKGEPGDAYDSFIDDLATLLNRFVVFRCLIVDDFTKLDNVTRNVLEAYLRYYANRSQDELWVLFSSTNDKWLEVPIRRSELISGKAFGYHNTRIYALQCLSRAQRHQLAEENGTPERAGYLTVRTILRDNSALNSMAELFQQEYDARKARTQGARTGDMLDFFYIFALNALPDHNPWMRNDDIRTDFSQQRKYRSRVLQLLMPGCDMSRTKVSGYLDLMYDTFFPLAGETSGNAWSRHFLAAPEAGEQLTDSWRNFDLANPGIVHLFWTLYWTDAKLRGALDLAMLPKICMHMLRSVPPAEIKEQLGGPKADIASFAQEYFNIALEILRACLRTCVLSDVPALFEHAMRLAVDDNEQVERRRRARLRPLVWQAYGLLGDERLLAVILDLQTAKGQRRRPTSQELDLTHLFMQSMTSADSEAREHMRNELTGAGKHASEYARIRAGWLAVSIVPFLQPGTPGLMAAAQNTRDRLPDIVAESVTSFESIADEEWWTTDILNVVLGIWSLTLASDDRRAAPRMDWDHSAKLDAVVVDALVRACVLGTDLVEQRRSADPSAVTLDLVLDCLAEELLVVLLGAGVLLLKRWPDSAWGEHAEQAEVVNVVELTARALGVAEECIPVVGQQPAPELIKNIERRMTLLAALWRRLGFDQQASFMAIQQTQFMALSHSPDAGLAQSALELLPEELHRADNTGLLAHLAAAECARVSEELTAQLLTLCGQASVKGGFGDQLAAELCLAAIRTGSSYNINFPEVLDYLLARWNEGDGRRLDTLLAAVAAEDMPFIVNDFLNALQHDDSGRPDHVRNALELRMAGVQDPQIEKEVRGQFRTFGLQRQRRFGQPVDVGAELAAWQEMRDLSEYAFVLYLLLPITPRRIRDRIMGEAVDVLKAPEKYVMATGYVLLAESMLLQMLAKRNETSPDFATALWALRIGFAALERILRAETNVDILRLLIRYDKEYNEAYSQKYIKWKKVVLELDETQRLPQLVDQGRFFLLIWHYFQFFADFGLPSAPPMDPFGLDDQEIAAALEEWRADNRSTPEPTVGTGKYMRLSGIFLRRGYALFFPPADQKSAPAAEKELEAGRRQFDRRAGDAVEDVYHMLRGLPHIPHSIEQILRRHEQLVLTRLNDLEGSVAND